ncbi:MAG TPA: bifunctional sulfate adenylyltransferase/adenylylsulfate kinase [Candidatus Marinimicrobia bacterium]|nr:bifunctional sulfate adenylyltransferase/adenylylsulfate kinase [Candidatus Neomarinimicrobiota bacterium]
MTLIEPHGGKLQELLLSAEKAAELKQEAKIFHLWTLSERQICDLEMILCGGFSPLKGFLTENDYDSVLDNLRLQDGTLWPIPITLDVSEEFAETVNVSDEVALRDKEGFVIAILTIESKWIPDKTAEAEKVLGTTDETHPGVNVLLNESHPVYLGGPVVGLMMPKQYDYTDLRHTPQQVRDSFKQKNWENVVAFQTRNPMHRAHVELTMRAAEEHNANILIHPVVGLTKPGDVDHYTRVRCYQYILSKYPENSAMLSLLPLAMRMAGPREALWHAIIRKNYGCNLFIVGRDHASPGAGKDGEPFYGPYDAQDLLKEHEDELGIKMVPFRLMVYVPGKDVYLPKDELGDNEDFSMISGTDLRDRLRNDEDIPEWFSYPEVVAELRRFRPALDKRGFTIFFTGLSGSGKSTLANGLLVKLMEDGRRPVTLLDGDIVRTHLSSELGFSHEHRKLNVRRIGFVASEITKNGGIAICAPIAPYQSDRRFNRELITPLGGFIEIHVDTPLSICEQRDAKGLYALARAGKLKQFTGIDDPYEEPENPEIAITSANASPEKLVNEIVEKIKELGYL